MICKEKLFIILSNMEFDFKKLFDKQKECCEELDSKIKTTDKQIDDMVYKIYNLAVEEINLIESDEKN